VRLFICLVVSAATLAGSPGVAWAAADPCGGTGGIGTFVRAGKASFTMTRNTDGAEQVVHVARPSAIETANGSTSLSGLRIGDRVTLVGDPESDGSFTASAVVVCEPRPHAKGSARGPRSGHARRSAIRRSVTTTRPMDAGQADRWRARIDRAALLLVGLTWIGMLAMLRMRKGQGLVPMLFFTIFFVYVVAVLDRTLFQFQSLIVLKHFAPQLMLNGQGDGDTVNLIPLVQLTHEDVKTSLLNVLLMVPFGFGLPCITNLRFARTVTAGALFSVVIEVLQLVTGLIGGITFRIADVNDVIFNATGAVLGYWLFAGFVRVCRGMPGAKRVRGTFRSQPATRSPVPPT
jgi:glycopeptide antibiotics resistance protein